MYFIDCIYDRLEQYNLNFVRDTIVLSGDDSKENDYRDGSWSWSYQMKW